MANRQAAARLVMSHERFKRIVNAKVFPHEKGGNFIRLSGFKYDDFNRAGLPNITRINKLVDLNRVTQWTGVDFSKLIVFLVGRRWTVNADFYRRAAIDYPMKLHWSVVGVGRSSIDIQQSLYEDDDQTADNARRSVLGLPLASSVSRIVSVDPATTKPAPLPGPVYESLTAAAVTDLGLQRFDPIRPPSEIPGSAYTCRIRVRYNDMDLILHTNQGSYLEFALECAAEAAESGFYSKLRQDVAFHRIKTTYANYLSVSEAGDELDISTWEDKDNALLLHFGVSKQGQMIYYAQVEFYDDDAAEDGVQS